MVTAWSRSGDRSARILMRRSVTLALAWLILGLLYAHSGSPEHVAPGAEAVASSSSATQAAEGAAGRTDCSDDHGTHRGHEASRRSPRPLPGTGNGRPAMAPVEAISTPSGQQAWHEPQQGRSPCPSQTQLRSRTVLQV
jgi:hypothetical protein